jgi:hypothetical protein
VERIPHAAAIASRPSHDHPSRWAQRPAAIHVVQGTIWAMAGSGTGQIEHDHYGLASGRKTSVQPVESTQFPAQFLGLQAWLSA